MFSLENLYAPKCIISSSKKKGCYVQIKPSAYLSRFIYCYWASPADSDIKLLDLLPPKDEFIVPDGCLDIVFSIDKQTKACESTVFGTLDKPFLGKLAYDKVQSFGITFYPGGFHPFIKIPLIELKNSTYSLDDVMQGKWKELCIEIERANTIFEMFNASNKYFSSLLDKQYISDSLCNLLYMIYKSRGNITVNKLAQNEVISERQIGRIFNNWVGISPKTLSRIVRFQNVIKSTIYSTNIDWLNIALDHGYFDESHFFNEFKELYGAPPSVYLESI